MTKTGKPVVRVAENAMVWLYMLDKVYLNRQSQGRDLYEASVKVQFSLWQVAQKYELYTLRDLVEAYLM